MEVNFFSGPEFRNEVEEIIETLMSESDRGAVLVASSMIEEGLMELISAFLLPSVNTKDELFHGPSAPLSTLEARISTAFRLGLLRQSVAAGLGLFRKLRNDFAHKIEILNFDSPSCKNRLIEIYRLIPELSEDLDKKAINHGHHPLPPRFKFILFFASTIAGIRTVKKTIKQLPAFTE